MNLFYIKRLHYEIIIICSIENVLENSNPDYLKEVILFLEYYY